MKVLILNGSPNKNGNTSFILSKFKEKFPINTDFKQIDAYSANIKPCMDCRYCWKNKGCRINDDMSIIFKDDYDVIVLASPVYMYHVTPPLFSIITRLNVIWSNNYFLKISNQMKSKKAVLILTSGENDSPDSAIKIAKIAFNFLNASFDIQKDYIYALNTNHVSVKDNKNISILIDKTINHVLNN